jgi:hypothetical protein
MLSEDLQYKLIREFLSEYEESVELEDSLDEAPLEDLIHEVHRLVENEEQINPSSEISLTLTASFDTSVIAEDLIFNVENAVSNERMTRDIADDGFESCATVEDIEIEDIFEF